MNGKMAATIGLRAGAAMLMALSAIASAQSDGVEVPEPDPLRSEASAPEASSVDPVTPDPMPAAAPSVEVLPFELPILETPPPPPPAPDIGVLDSQLFATVTDADGTQAVTPTTSIPYVVGRSCYGWALKYTPVEGDLMLTEELILPGPARNWGTEGSKTQVNAQRSHAITERHFDASTGVASAGWCVAKDDPVGAYRYIIRQGEREVARFDFTVGDLL